MSAFSITSCDYGQVTDYPWALASSSVKGAKVVTSIVRTSYIGHLFFSGITFKAEQERPLPAMKTVVGEGWGGLGVRNHPRQSLEVGVCKAGLRNGDTISWANLNVGEKEK